MIGLWLIPFAIMGALITIDEFHYHRKRGLPRWERIGHPIDAMSVITCLAFTLVAPFNRTTVLIYLGLAMASSLIITKDEWVHANQCSGGEQWLHSLLFMVHPWVLAVSALFWASLSAHPWVSSFESWTGWMLPDPTTAATLIIMQVSIVSLFLIYQVIHWKFLWS